MAGKTLLPPNPKDFSDPFNAGQMVGMLTILMFIEKNKGINDKMIQDLKWTCAENASDFFWKFFLSFRTIFYKQFIAK